jgi:hypothetical protein
VLIGGVNVKVNCGLEPKAIPVTFESVPIVGAVGTDETNPATPSETKEVPRAFVAVIVYVYVPEPDSVIRTGEVAPVLVAPLDDVTVNPVMVEPPVAFAVKATLA